MPPEGINDSEALQTEKPTLQPTAETQRPREQRLPKDPQEQLAVSPLPTDGDRSPKADEAMGLGRDKGFERQAHVRPEQPETRHKQSRRPKDSEASSSVEKPPHSAEYATDESGVARRPKGSQTIQQTLVVEPLASVQDSSDGDDARLGSRKPTLPTEQRVPDPLLAQNMPIPEPTQATPVGPAYDAGRESVWNKAEVTVSDEVRVTIGRIEVNAVVESAAPARRQPTEPKTKALSLDEFLASRDGTRR